MFVQLCVTRKMGLHCNSAVYSPVCCCYFIEHNMQAAKGRHSGARAHAAVRSSRRCHGSPTHTHLHAFVVQSSLAYTMVTA